MTNLRTDEIVFFFRNLTKIGTDENKAMHSKSIFKFGLNLQMRDSRKAKIRGRRSPN